MEAGQPEQLGRAGTPPKLRDAAVVGLGLVLAVLIGGGLLAYTNAERLARHNERVAHTHEVIGASEALLSTLKDAETGQRGYLLAEDDKYLQPYDAAVKQVGADLARLKELTSDNPDQQARLAALDRKVAVWLDELGRTVASMKAGDRAAAMNIVRSGTGKAVMDDVRQDIAAVQRAENDVLAGRDGEAASYRTTVLSIFFTTLAGVVLVGVVYYLNRRNIRQRERAAVVVAEQGERLRTTLASIGDAVITTDTEGRVTNMNAVAVSLTGWTTDEAAGQPLGVVFNIVNETTRKAVESPATRALREGVIVGLANHTVLLAKDGTERPIDDSAAPIRCKEGEVVGCVLVFRDVTERRREEVAQAERLRLVALRGEVSTALAAAQPLRAGLQGCCEAFVRHLGVAFARIWTHDEAAGVLALESSAGQYTYIDGPHSRIRVGEYKIGRIAQSRRPLLTNDVTHDPNISDPAWAEREGMVAFAGYPLTVEGRLVGVVAMFAHHPLTDATLTDLAPLTDQIAQHISRKWADDALRESEQRYRLVGQAANDAIWDWDLVTNRVAWSEGVRRVFGYAEEQVGPEASWWVEHIHPDDRDRITHGIHAAIDGGGELWQDEYRYRRADGSYAEVFDRGRVVRDGGGRPVRMVGSMLDLTERKRVETDLRERETFIGGVLGSITDAFYAVGKDWRFTFANDETVRRFGRPRNEIVGGHIWKMFPDAVGSVAHTQLHRAMADRVAVEYEVFYEPWGRWFLDNAFPTDDGGLAVYTRDITDRRQAGVELRESRQRLEAVLDSISDGLLVIDREWRYVYFSEQAARIAGVRREDMIGGVVWELYPHAEGTKFYDGYHEAVATGRAVHFEEFYPAPLNKWLECHCYPSGDGLTVYFRDVTDRKRAEQAVRESEERSAFVRRASGVGFWYCDLPFDVLQWDELVKAHFHLPPDAAVTIQTFYDRIHPDDREPTRWAIERSIAGRTPYDVDYRTVDPDTGAVTWVRAIGRTFYAADGTPTRFDGVTLDVTDRKRAEQEREATQGTLATLIERCPFGIYIVDADFRIVHMNTGSQAGAFANVRPVIGRAFDEALRILWPEPVAAEVVRRFRHTLDTGEPYHSADFVNPRADIGQTEGYEFELHRVSLPDGRPGVVCYYYDSTKLRQAEQALKDADRRKDEFLATLAHELRNPLAPIRNGLQVLKMAGTNGSSVEQARTMMERQLEQMVRLVDDLMDVSRISRGKLELKKERVPLTAVVNSAVETSRPLIEQMGHDLTVTLPDHPVVIDADLTRLAQVFLNLLNNAAKYSDRGGHIRLSAERQGSDAVVSVRDTGIGIAADQLPHIFEMFSQVDRSLEKAQGGLGIGLSLVKKLVEMHGGSIEARSAGLGEGSEFVVRLPVVVEASVPQVTGRGDPQPVQKSSLRILIVDDNQDGADSLSDMLGIMGNDTRTAYDGAAAVAAAGEFQPDVILLDIGLPKLNGYEACRRIREQPGGEATVIIAQTGWGQDEDRQRTKEAGFDHHLVKPVDPTALMKLLTGLTQARV